MTSYSSVGETLAREHLTERAVAASQQVQPSWADKYRGATVEDLDPPPALSVSPNDSILSAQLAAYERDYTHLTVISSKTRALIGYLNIPRLKELLREGKVKESDPVRAAMQRFNRKPGNIYHVITMATPLEELERFFKGEIGPREGYAARREKQEFAIVTDAARKFVLGVVTQQDLEEFVKRRPA
ncbi:hypothetical protein VTN96DRAFT_5930 [Rasamsonia emersonii]|uniref:Cystathionine beta-synthase (Beta-thionase) n=1 Tax=Rasamsonia emersonii (strain ATCC 16479 / CBS 393.64 / IMI 116815) TaxID=1408163 RepID=A0A0F4Z5H1_RASE3|nr:Cystathionine beta-synthase (Beta-thionase) [Rasamsonia emersonii CBS 393.64]KKA25590.1 Cystathionine beta-synthase (Beta-thionase) [Rasamsonia emersonii CBS 393.64]